MKKSPVREKSSTSIANCTINMPAGNASSPALTPEVAMQLAMAIQTCATTVQELARALRGPDNIGIKVER
jgi:hypothetical protein